MFSQPAVRILFFVCLATSVGSVGALSWILLDRGATQQSVESDAAKAIDAAAAKANFQRHTTEFTWEKAERARLAILQRDFPTARQITAGVLANSHLENWRFHPFSEFMASIVDLHDAKFATALDEWVAENQQDAIPLLVRAQYDYAFGWFKRGHRFSKYTAASDRAAFADAMRQGRQDIEAAIGIDGNDPYAYELQLRILRGSGVSPAMERAFNEVVARFPGYYAPYVTVLRALEPKWGGSVDAMYAFVDRYVGSNALPNSPLRLLYLELYRDLLDTAAIDCNSYWYDLPKMTQCVAADMTKFIRSSLQIEVPDAFRLYDSTDRYEFGLAFDIDLTGMLETRGGADYSGSLLELAATRMHSDTRLKETKQRPNDYIIDKLVAESWFSKGFYDNALQKADEALDDLKATAFPDDETRELAVANIYELIARVDNLLHHNAEMIAYERAAFDLGDGSDFVHLICGGYWFLKEYVTGIRECTKLIDRGIDNVKLYYWRGMSYKDAGQPDAALNDLSVVVDSQDEFRSSAAITMSMIYFGRNDMRAALDVLNSHKYLYDPNVESRDNVAVSFNNRCYAYMELGELHKALDDCTASLKYGSLPDAYRKQQELITRITAQTGQR